MKGFAPILRKEYTEFFRTWRVWVVGGAFVLFGLIDPVVAKFTNQILSSAFGETPLELPDPTYLDAWAQWSRDLSQLLLIVVLVVAAGTVAGEVNSGTLIMPLTKPLSRTGVVLAKFTALSSLVALSAVISTGLTTLVTMAFFADVQFAPVWRAVGVWFVLALTFIAATMAVSCLVPSTVAAFGIAFALQALMMILAIWQPVKQYSLIGLTEAVSMLATNQDVELIWPVATAFGAIVVFLVLAIVIFRRKEL
ncbi:MAG: ABC transporter permease subunit [Acidobacteriota bacterium]|nr:ABC transporter permease subunit [Acidobacteriota bacterium]